MGMDLVTDEQAVTSLLVDSGIKEEDISEMVLELEAIIDKYGIKTFKNFQSVVALLTFWRD